jgi:MoaA/NifB/PqqE/SkfB family radical SAM enzyme
MVPITIQGGEPSMHKEWLDILQGIDERFYIDILTNLTFNLDDFICAVPPKRFYRDVPYAPIRVSYHPEQADFDDVLKRAHKLWRHGYDIGIFTVDHPDIDIPPLRKKAEKMGLDFRSKEFLGWHQGKLYGQYKYPESVNGTPIGKTVKCKTTELLIAPDGRIHRCHRDLYAGENPIGHILDKDFQMDFKFRKCDRIGECSCCDLKIKNNRFQQMGACSVEVMDG